MSNIEAHSKVEKLLQAIAEGKDGSNVAADSTEEQLLQEIAKLKLAADVAGIKDGSISVGVSEEQLSSKVSSSVASAMSTMDLSALDINKRVYCTGGAFYTSGKTDGVASGTSTFDMHEEERYINVTVTHNVNPASHSYLAYRLAKNKADAKKLMEDEKKFLFVIKPDKDIKVTIALSRTGDWGTGIVNKINTVLKAGISNRFMLDFTTDKAKTYFSNDIKVTSANAFIILKGFDGYANNGEGTYNMLMYVIDITDSNKPLGYNDVAGKALTADTADGLSDVGTKSVRDAILGGGYITCWGDSLTAMGGWTNVLQTKTGLKVNNCGIGGETVKGIAARQGADLFVVNNITIPADTTPVVIANRYVDGAYKGLDTVLGKNAPPLLQGGDSMFNPCTIGGIEGTFKYTGSNYMDTAATWTFTRTTAGEAKVIDRPTPIVPACDKNMNSPQIMIIFMGQNGGYADLDDLINYHKLMIAHAKARNVLILGMHSGSAESRAEYEAAMTKEFGRHFISLRQYLVNYGLQDAGMTATEEDTAALATGTVPPQLLSDGVHYKTEVRTIIGNMLYEKICELNMLD